MRSEREMFDLILDVAKSDERIKAVVMNGSRTNSHVTRDLFQDYDIVYLVDNVTSFIDDPEWIDVFGERLILQTPETMTLVPPQGGGRFAYLMLFADGNRIDLTLVPMEEKELFLQEDKLTRILLDKEGVLPELPPPTDEDYLIKKPTAALFGDCCNEFWWVSTYVAKGLWRKEILYAYDHMNIVRNMLLQMLIWKVGFETGFSCSVGKNAKFLSRYVDQDTWRQLLLTFPGGSVEQIWRALDAMTELFEQTAQQVAAALEAVYPLEEYRKVKNYLSDVHRLAPNATVFQPSRLEEAGLRTENGPFPMSRESRLEIAEEIKERVLETHGERVKAIGIYGSMGRGSDGPYSDLEVRCVLNSAGEEYNHEWSAGAWKAEVNFVSEDILLEDVCTIEGDWPLTHGQFLSVLPLYDPDGFFANLKQTAISQDEAKFRHALQALMVEEMFEYAGKWRNAGARGTESFLPALAVKTAEAGAMLIGLHHRTCYSTGARVLSEALELPNRPEGFDRLCQLVMTGQLSESESVLEALEVFWEGVNGWSARNGYTMTEPRRIPF